MEENGNRGKMEYEERDEDEEEVVEGKRTTYGGSKESESVAADVIIVALHIPFCK